MKFSGWRLITMLSQITRSEYPSWHVLCGTEQRPIYVIGIHIIQSKPQSLSFTIGCYSNDSFVMEEVRIDDSRSKFDS